ncbi:MAG: ubiquitin-like domain-containing protein, partial [Anaerolineales bacterium]|nr:ubiquitin-like domain-containing protein [Anaerolineales bacterium]
MRISSAWTLLSLFILLFSTSCGQESASVAVTILDGSQVFTLTSKERIPASFIASAGLSLSHPDQVLYHGIVVNPDQFLPLAKTYSLQIRRAVPLTLTENRQSRIIHTTAQTIGQALNETGIKLTGSDRLDPPVETPL